MAREYDDEQIAKFKLVNALLRKALRECEMLIRKAELLNAETGQDNDPRDASQASPPSA